MIRLEPNTVNSVVVTLNELATLATPFYLFEFIKDDTNETKIFTASNVSTSRSRYDEFNITTTTGTEDLLNGVIDLKTKGYYTYNIYEQVSSTNLNLANITSLVEVGKVYMNDVKNPVRKEYEDQTNTKKVYNG
jgi:hypothetical protein